jgi:predicted  nucleic acid-binding Zn-ribbon protein
MHLLVETAIGDSQEFEVLSFEEIDELKKESVATAGRIDALRRKLTLESKVRDAASSLSRLNAHRGDGSESSPKRHRRSVFGSKGSGGELLDKTDDELAASNRKCDELAQELWKAEKRSTEIQKRLLQHTAGILQMTHRSNAKKTKLSPKELGQNGRAGSPGSIYTYSRGSVQPIDDDDEWDDRSQYRTLDEFSSVFDGRLKSRSPAGLGLSGPDLQAISDTERKLQDLNSKLRAVIVHANPQRGQSFAAPPPQALNGSALQGSAVLQEQLDYLETGLDTVEKELQNSAPLIAKVDQSEPVLRDLWSTLQGGEADARERKQKKGANQSVTSEGDSEISADEGGASDTPYSLQTLASTVQNLHRRTVALREEKAILRRQIKQQRAINGGGDASREAEIASLKANLEQTDAEATKAREEVAVVMDRLEALQAQRLGEENDAVAALQSEISSHRDETRSRIKGLEKSLAEANTAHETVQSKHIETSAQLSTKETELQDLESEVVRLQTEVTIARAELDGAYGSRAQRAADAAASPAFQREMEELVGKNKSLQAEIERLNDEKQAVGSQGGELKDRVSVLEKELGDTIAEYEVLTKQSIEFERERESLEQSIDKLKERCENLESQLSEEKLRWMGVKPSGKDGGKAAESTSTMVLRNEFKKMMKDTRSDHAKVLKVCHSEIFWRSSLTNITHRLSKKNEENSRQHSEHSRRRHLASKAQLQIDLETMLLSSDITCVESRCEDDVYIRLSCFTKVCIGKRLAGSIRGLKTLLSFGCIRNHSWDFS